MCLEFCAGHLNMYVAQACLGNVPPPKLTYPEFPFESEAKGDSFIEVYQRQLKIERMLTILPRALSWASSGFRNTSALEKRLRI